MVMSTHTFTTIAPSELDTTRGGAGDFPGFQGCGPNYFSKGCVDGGMNLSEQLAISQHAKMVNGKTATFGNWASWMRQHDYPSKALDSIGYPKR
jgi:hypothetical protein